MKIYLVSVSKAFDTCLCGNIFLPQFRNLITWKWKSKIHTKGWWRQRITLSRNGMEQSERSGVARCGAAGEWCRRGREGGGGDLNGPRAQVERMQGRSFTRSASTRTTHPANCKAQSTELARSAITPTGADLTRIIWFGFHLLLIWRKPQNMTSREGEMEENVKVNK